jgi:hypothetical protein
MNQPIRIFRLADEVGAGLSCDGAGLVLGETPLLERDAALGWRLRPLDELNAAGAACYGLPVDFAAKLAGLRAAAAALDRGEVALAKIAALQLCLPDPPPLSKGPLAEGAFIELAYALQSSGILAKTFDEAKHPRWPGGSPDHQGGQFAPAGEAGADAEAASPPLTPVGLVKPLANLAYDPDAQKLAEAINRLRAGDGTQQVKVSDGTELSMSRAGSHISLTVTKAHGLLNVTLSGTYSDAPGVDGVDIKGIHLSTSVPGLSFSVLPNNPGDRTALDAEIRVAPEVEGHTPDGRPIARSALNVRYNHTIAVDGQPIWRRGLSYGF